MIFGIFRRRTMPNADARNGLPKQGTESTCVLNETIRRKTKTKDETAKLRHLETAYSLFRRAMYESEYAKKGIKPVWTSDDTFRALERHLIECKEAIALSQRAVTEFESAAELEIDPAKKTECLSIAQKCKGIADEMELIMPRLLEKIRCKRPSAEVKEKSELQEREEMLDEWNRELWARIES